jgi:hypothetical protein
MVTYILVTPLLGESINLALPLVVGTDSYFAIRDAQVFQVIGRQSISRIVLVPLISAAC